MRIREFQPGSIGEATHAANIYRNIERLIEELDFHRLVTGNLIYAVEFREGGGWTGKANFMEPTALFLDLMTAAKAMPVQACDLGRPINRMQIMAEKLSLRSCYQRKLLPNTEPEKHLLITEVKAAINEKIGRFALRGGQTAALPEIYADDASEWDICNIRGKICF